MLNSGQLGLIIRESTLSPMERLLLIAMATDPNLLIATNQQIADQLTTSTSHVSRAIGRFKQMNIFSRSLQTRELVLKPFDQWRLLSR